MKLKNIFNSKLALFSLILLLIFSLVGCSSNDDNNTTQLTFVDSTPASGSSNIEIDLSQITLDFNKNLSGAEISLINTITEEQINPNFTREGSKVIINDFTLQGATEYKVSYDIKDNDGNNLTGTINFTTDEPEVFEFSSSNPTDGSNDVLDIISEIELNFSQDISEIVSLKLSEAGTELNNITANKSGRQLLVTGFDLQEDTSYQVDYEVKNSNGENLVGTINFATKISPPQLIDSSPIDNAVDIDPSLTEIKINFDETFSIDSIKLLEEGTEKTDISTSINNNELLISNIGLTTNKSYTVEYSVTGEDGKLNSSSINFITKPDTSLPSIPESERNKTMMQAFYWEMPTETDLWQLLQTRASELSKVGITSLWLPPANKGMGGSSTVGYDNYELWDLGEFDQKGSTRTKYGTKKELEEAIQSIHDAGMKAYYDVIFNHRMGADADETATLSDGSTMNTWTKFTPQGRAEYYTQDNFGDLYHDFTWNWETGFDAYEGNLFQGKDWDYIYGGGENDHLMGSDVDYGNWNDSGDHIPNTEVVDERKAWGQWVVEDIGFDGFRIDAIKHIDNHFINEWVDHMQTNTDKDLFFVGEAWIEDTGSLQEYIDSVEERDKDNDLSDLDLFDFPLRNKFKAMRDGGGSFDMSSLKGAGLVNSNYSNHAVTFIDNHDTSGANAEDYGKSRIDNYNYQAYAYALTRKGVTPTVFWKDYYQHEMKEKLDKLIKARRYFAYGAEHEVSNNDDDVYSYVREGLADVDGDGLVLMISDGTSGTITTKTIDARQADTKFYDYTGNISETVTTDSNGNGDFKVKESKSGGWSIWVPVN